MSYRVPGPCTIEFGGADIGVTKSGVIFRPNTSLVPITDDRRGAAPGTYLFGGKSCVIEIIGMNFSDIEDADIWDGGALQLGANGVGSLASTGAKSLVIVERDTISTWTCNAFPTDPRELNMKSTQEMNLPLLFVVVMDQATGKLFSTVPAYIG